MIFELTESAAIAHLDQAKRFSRRLQRLGCSFALDDFGTGYGSFIHLKHLPFDFIKIDGEFVRGITSNPYDRLLVEALARFAKGTGKRTIAEFVGDDDTAVLLRELGVDYGQGYHLGRPSPADQLPTATTDSAGTSDPSVCHPHPDPTLHHADAVTRRLQRAYLQTITAGDPQAAGMVIDDAQRRGLAPVEIQSRVIAPAMRTIGELWERNRLTIAQEHLAATISHRMLARLAPGLRAGPHRPGDTIVVAAVPGEHHVLGLQMAADVLSGAGFDVASSARTSPRHR